MAPPADPPNTITLRIKVPPGQIPGGADEFSLGSEVSVSSKVGQIRERIQETIPSSPTPERQRLLYAGRALIDNEQSLADALNIRRDPSQNEYVVHLLIKGDGTGTAPAPHRRGVSTPTRSASPATAPTPGERATQPQPQPHPQPGIPLPQAHPMHAHLPHAPYMYPHLTHGMPMPPQPNRMVPGAGFVPNGAQPVHYGAPMGPMAAWAQHQALHQAAVIQAQQQHAGGQRMHGTARQPPDGALQSHAQPQTIEPGQQPHRSENEAATAQQQQHHPSLPNSSHRPLSGQGIHMEGFGPNGQRITIHQQTLNFPHAAFPGQQMQVPPPSAGQAPTMSYGLPSLPGMPQQNQAPLNRPSALDQARENIAEMRRMLDELRNSSADDQATEAQRERIVRLEERTQALNDYIDPFRHLTNASTGHARSSSPRAPAPAQNVQHPSRSQTPANATVPIGWQQRAPQLGQALQQTLGRVSPDVTCYLLSSPTGPQAILYSPQHGTYAGSLPQQHASPSNLRPSPTVTATNATAPTAAGQGQPNQPPAPGNGEAAARGQQQAPAAPPDPLGPLAPLLGHMWLLLRVLIFSYFLLGANLGWRRPLALLAIGLGFWMIRAGLLGDGGALRRWWDGIVNEGRQRQPADQGRGPAQQQEGQQTQPQGEGQLHGQRQNQAPAADNGNARPGQMPTPEQVAQRLLNEDARQREAARSERVQWLRERIRPVERALALLLASLWPGVGEAYVRAREQEERRRAEEEIAARRQEEEERERKESEKAQVEEGGEGAGEDGGESKGAGEDAAPVSTAPDENAVAAQAAPGEETAQAAA